MIAKAAIAVADASIAAPKTSFALPPRCIALPRREYYSERKKGGCTIAIGSALLIEIFSIDRDHNMRILTLCGSLRENSSNRAMLRAYARLAVDHSITHFEGVGDLPHFNPDLDREDRTVPAEVAELRKAVVEADLLLISTPEYAHGLPGSFKNALDWLVSEPGFDGKPVVILSAERGSKWAFESLREILRTMSAVVIDNACAFLPLGSNRVDDEAILGDANLRHLLETSVQATRNYMLNRPGQTLHH